MAYKPNASFKVEGLKDLDQSLERLQQGVGRRTARFALRKASKPMLEASRRKAPEGMTRELKSKIDTSLKTLTDYTSRINVESRAFYSRWVELGHKIVRGGRLRKGGKVVGSTRASGFMRGAFDENVDETVNIFKTELSKAVQRAVKRGQTK